MDLRLYFLFPALIFAGSCNNNAADSVHSGRPESKDIAAVNSYLVEKDRERIINFAERKNLRLNESKSGLWYMISKEGTGNMLKDRDHVMMEYSCYLLDGTPCYSSSKSGPKEVVIGKSEIEPGLNEGLKMLRPGSEALFVLPPFLAYGLLGDSKAIPPRSTVVYEIKIIK